MSIWYFVIHVFWCDKVGIDIRMKKKLTMAKRRGILVSTVIDTATDKERT